MSLVCGKKKKSGPSGEVPLPEGQRVLDTDDELMDQGDNTPGKMIQLQLRVRRRIAKMELHHLVWLVLLRELMKLYLKRVTI